MRELDFSEEACLGRLGDTNYYYDREDTELNLEGFDWSDPLNRVLRGKGYIDVDTMTSECDSDLSAVDFDSPTERAAYLEKKGFSTSALWILEKYINSGDRALLKKNLSLMAPLYEKMGKLEEAYDCRAALYTIDKNLKRNNKKLAHISKHMKKNPDLRAAA